MFSRDEPLLEGGDFRYFYVLKLHFDRLTLFPAALTLRHTIDEKSPLFGATPRGSYRMSRAVYRIGDWNRSSNRSVGPNPERLFLARYSVRQPVCGNLYRPWPGPAHGGLQPASRYRTGEVDFSSRRSSAALFRQQKNHPGKLGHSGDELVYDSREKWPEGAEQRYVIQLQEHGCHPEGSEHKEHKLRHALTLHVLDIQAPEASRNCCSERDGGNQQDAAATSPDSWRCRFNRK